MANLRMQKETVLNVLNEKQINKVPLNKIIEWLKEIQNDWKKLNNEQMVIFISRLAAAVINSHILISKLKKREET